MISESSGEVRNIRAGKKITVQADFGLETEFPYPVDLVRIEVLGTIYELFDAKKLKSLAFLGVFDREGRKVNVLGGETVGGGSVGLAFDVQTKMLMSFTDDYSTTSFGDFRKVGDVFLPYQVERSNFMKMNFTEIKINPVIDESIFLKKINCYDKEN